MLGYHLRRRLRVLRAAAAERGVHDPQRAAGRYELNAWHESSASIVKQSITVGADRGQRHRRSHPGRSRADGHRSGQVRQAPTVPARLLNNAAAHRPTIARRKLSGLALAAVVIATPWLSRRVAATQSRQRRVDEEAARAAREGGDLAREALALQLRVGGADDRERGGQPALPRGASRARRSPTFADLLATETWWEPYRVSWRRSRTTARRSRSRRRKVPMACPSARSLRRVGQDGKPLAQPHRRRAADRSWPPRGRCRSGGLARRCCCWRSRIDDAVLIDGRGPLGEAPSWSATARARWDAGRARRGAARGAGGAGSEGRRRAGGSRRARGGGGGRAPGLWLWTPRRAPTSHRQRPRSIERGVRCRGSWRSRSRSRSPRSRCAGAAARPPRLREPRQRGDCPERHPRRPRRSGTKRRRSPARRGPRRCRRSCGSPGPGTPLGRYLLVDRIGEGGMAEVYTAVSFGYGSFRRPFVVKRLRSELIAQRDRRRACSSTRRTSRRRWCTRTSSPCSTSARQRGSYFLAAGVRRSAAISAASRAGCATAASRCCRVSAILHLAHEMLDRARVRARQARRRRAPAGARPPRRHARERDHLRAGRGEGARLRHHEGHAARVADRERHGEVGTSASCRPSRRAGKPVDHRSDLFSTGLVILYAATGEPTYPGETFYDLLTAAASGLSDDAAGAHRRACRRRCPRSSGARSSSTRPSRFQTSAEFSAAIAPYLVGAGGATELGASAHGLFGDELRAEQDRLAAAFAQRAAVNFAAAARRPDRRRRQARRRPVTSLEAEPHPEGTAEEGVLSAHGAKMSPDARQQVEGLR